VTCNPSAEWLAQQMAEAFPWNTAPTYLVRDNDRSYGQAFQRRIRAMGIRDRPIPPRSPRQNAYVERLIGTLRRESLSRPENRQHVHSLYIADDHFTCVRGTAEIRMSARAESQSSQIIRLNVGDFFTST
jgi:Integrase core domain